MQLLFLLSEDKQRYWRWKLLLPKRVWTLGSQAGEYWCQQSIWSCMMDGNTVRKAPRCPDTGPKPPPLCSHCTPRGILLLMSFRTCEKGLKYTRQIIRHDSLENVVYLKCSQSAECMPVVTVITHFLFWPSWEITDLERSNLNVTIFAVSKVFFLFYPSGSGMYCVSFFSTCSEHTPFHLALLS